jgi:hypothetical protein
MRKSLAFAICSLLLASPAYADFFSVEIDAQGGYTQLDAIEYPDAPYGLTDLAGPAFGVHGKVEILFISAVIDYQHILGNDGGADLLHLGLGADFKLPLGVVEPFVRGSAGLGLLYAQGSAFDPAATDDFPATAGFLGRVGAGLDIPLGDWFALGLAGDVGIHYFTQELGFNFSVMGYFGLRI